MSRHFRAASPHPSVAIVTSGSPELTQLAVALEARGMLSAFAHPLILPHPVESGKTVRQMLRVPKLGTSFARRLAPIDLPAKRLIRVAPMLEISRALLGTRFPRLQRILIRRRNQLMGRAAKRLAKGADFIVISHACATGLDFENIDAQLWLNMPSSHPAYQNAQLDLLEHERPQVANLPSVRQTQAEVEEASREYAGASVILVGSEFVSETLIEFGVDSQKIRVVPYGVDLSQFHPDLHRKETIPLKLVCLSSLLPNKGVLDLVDAMQFVPDNVAELTFIGRAPYGTDWLGEGPYRLAGRIEHHELPTVLSSASAMVLPSWFEGLPLSVLESLASGLPCIVTDRGAGQAVRDGIEGHIVPPGNPKSIADAIMQMAEDPNKMREMSLAARSRAETFSWDAYGNAVSDLILNAWHNAPIVARDKR